MYKALLAGVIALLTGAAITNVLSNAPLTIKTTPVGVSSTSSSYSLAVTHV